MSVHNATTICAWAHFEFLNLFGVHNNITRRHKKNEVFGKNEHPSKFHAFKKRRPSKYDTSVIVDLGNFNEVTSFTHSFKVTSPATHMTIIRQAFHDFKNKKWRYTILCSTLIYIISWTLFALFYFAIEVIRDKFGPNNQKFDACFSTQINAGGHLDDHPGSRKSRYLKLFQEMVFFSVETQVTIGYGTRSIKRGCPEQSCGSGAKPHRPRMKCTFFSKPTPHEIHDQPHKASIKPDFFCKPRKRIILSRLELSKLTEYFF